MLTSISSSSDTCAPSTYQERQRYSNCAARRSDRNHRPPPRAQSWCVIHIIIHMIVVMQPDRTELSRCVFSRLQTIFGHSVKYRLIQRAGLDRQ